MAGGEGSTFGKYFLLKKIASGGMGEIFLAKLKGPVGFEKLLVIKRILAQHCENQEFVDMFFAEARVAAQLNHSNIVQIFEMGEIEDAYFIGMEYVHGKSLRDVIDRVRDRGEYLHPAHVVEIISRLCAGMAYAHNATDMVGQSIGIIHRDINPHNLLVSYTGEVKIIDFGIAKSEMSLHKTETGTIKGKFVYMSPEQSAAEHLDKRSDIFSIGICLYEALSGFNPFAKANIVLSLDAIQRKEPPPITETSPKLEPFVPILAKALTKKPEDRYPDCAVMRDELLALLASGAVERPPQSLADYMHDLFEDHIESAKRMLLETDQANTVQLQKMQDFRRQEHRSGTYRRLQSQVQPRLEVQEELQEEIFEEAEADELEEAAHTAAVVLEPAPHSRVPFILMLSALIAGTAVGSVVVVKYVQAKRLGTPVVASGGVVNLQPTSAAPQSTTIASPSGQPTAAPPTPLGSPAPTTQVATPPAAPPTTPPATPTAAPTATSTPQQVASLTPSSSTPSPTKERDRDRDRDRDKGRRGHRDDSRNDAPASAPSSAPASPPPPPPPPPPAAATTTAAAPTSFGNMQISCVPPVHISLAGASVGQSIKLKNASGTLVLGSGSDSKSDPFKLTIRYRVTNGTIAYAVDAEPWAIVRGKGGIGLGKTPLPPQQGEEGTTVFEFANPKEQRNLRVSLRFSP